MVFVDSLLALNFAIVGYGALVGLSLGLTGSGGSILAIPFLVYGLGLPIETALPASLLMVAAISLFGAIRQSFMGNVDWTVALVFSIAGMIIAPVVIYYAQNVHETLRLVLFALLMLLVALRMLYSSKTALSPKGHQPSTPSAARIALSGASVGVLSGFFGVGGGFIIVPQLTLLFSKPYAQAVGTSLASIFLISLSAIMGTFIKGGQLDWKLLIPFIGGGIIGLMLGSRFVDKLPERQAKQSFAAIISILALLMLLDKFYFHFGAHS